jgi:hypothetical protein
MIFVWEIFLDARMMVDLELHGTTPTGSAFLIVHVAVARIGLNRTEGWRQADVSAPVDVLRTSTKWSHESIYCVRWPVVIVQQHKRGIITCRNMLNERLRPECKP